MDRMLLADELKFVGKNGRAQSRSREEKSMNRYSDYLDSPGEKS